MGSLDITQTCLMLYPISITGSHKSNAYTSKAFSFQRWFSCHLCYRLIQSQASSQS